jgi:hypothetical protein
MLWVFPSEIVKARHRISLTVSAIFHFPFLQFAHGVKRSGSGAEAEFYPKKASAVAFKERVGNKFLSPLGNRSRRRQERMSQLPVVLAHVLDELGDLEVVPAHELRQLSGSLLPSVLGGCLLVVPFGLPPFFPKNEKPGSAKLALVQEPQGEACFLFLFIVYGCITCI